MPYSFQLHTATSGQTVFSFASIDGFVTSGDLRVYVNGTLQSTSGVYTVNTTTFNVTFLSGRTVGDTVLIRRFTDALRADREVNFEDGSILTATDLDNSALQLLYLVQEGLDEAKEFCLRLNDALTAWDAKSKKITNVSTPVAGTDAANKTYVDNAAFGTISGAANQVLATPTGAAGNATLRVLAAADIPTLTAVKISDFDSQVQTSRLNQMTAPNASVSMNSQKIVSVLDPTTSQDAATKAYVDGLVFNLNPQTVNATNIGTAGFKAEIDLNSIDSKRLAIINTTLTIAAPLATTTHFIRLKNSGASSVKCMVLWASFAWEPIGVAVSATDAPTSVPNMPWNYNLGTFVQGITTVTPSGFAYFQGTGNNWTGTADITDSVQLFGGPSVTGAQFFVKVWILRLN
jgi:hypothetical protein